MGRREGSPMELVAGKTGTAQVGEYDFGKDTYVDEYQLACRVDDCSWLIRRYFSVDLLCVLTNSLKPLDFYVAFQIIGKYLLFINCLLSIT